MFRRNAWPFVFAAAVLPMLATGQDRAETSTTDAPVTVTGKRIESDDLKNADVVGTYTPEEFIKLLKTQQQCRNETLQVRTDGDRMFLDDGDFALDDFGEELARRYKLKPFYCVKIVGPGHDVRLLTKFLRNLKGSEVASIDWVPK